MIAESGNITVYGAEKIIFALTAASRGAKRGRIDRWRYLWKRKTSGIKKGIRM